MSKIEVIEEVRLVDHETGAEQAIALVKGRSGLTVACRDSDNCDDWQQEKPDVEPWCENDWAVDLDWFVVEDDVQVAVSVRDSEASGSPDLARKAMRQLIQDLTKQGYVEARA